MGVLRNRDGKIIGTTDEPGRGSVGLFVCPRSAAIRVREGCQPGGMGALDAKTKFACSKSQERRFGLGCERRHTLSSSERKIAAEDAALRKGKTMATRRYAPLARDVAVPLEGWRGDGTMSARILNACRMDDFSPEELAEVEKLLGAAGVEPDMAADSMFPHQNRLGSPVFDRSGTPRPPGRLPALTSEELAFRRKFLPNYERLK